MIQPVLDLGCTLHSGATEAPAAVAAVHLLLESQSICDWTRTYPGQRPDRR